jgi:hypothetical protein
MTVIVACFAGVCGLYASDLIYDASQIPVPKSIQWLPSWRAPHGLCLRWNDYFCCVVVLSGRVGQKVEDTGMAIQFRLATAHSAYGAGDCDPCLALCCDSDRGPFTVCGHTVERILSIDHGARVLYAAVALCFLAAPVFAQTPPTSVEPLPSGVMPNDYFNTAQELIIYAEHKVIW